MQRLLAIVAATAAAAAVAAAISLPAGAAKTGSDELTTFISCMRAHGAAIPEGLDPYATKQWLGAHEEEAVVAKAMDACNAGIERHENKGDTASPAELVSCLHDHGLEAPATIDQLKPWVLQQLDTAAGKAALAACGFDSRPVEKGAGGGGCGGDKAEHAATTSKAKARAAKPAPAAQPAQ